jgi:hypothetical protein
MENIVLITVRNKNDIKYDDVEIEKINHYHSNPQRFIEDFKRKTYLSLTDDIVFPCPVVLSDEDEAVFNGLTNHEKWQYFIDSPNKFDTECCKRIITENKELANLFNVQTFLHIKNSNIYFYDCINSYDTEYWDEIKKLLDRIKPQNTSEETPVYLVLHIGDNYLLNITDASVFYKDDFHNSANWEKTDNDAEHWNKVIKKLNGYSIKTVTAFHHSDSNKIYTDIIKNQKFWKECNTNKTVFITKVIKDYYNKDDFKNSILDINGEYLHITNGNKEDSPNWNKLLNGIDQSDIVNNKSDDYIILYATEHCFKLNDFFLALANFQLSGCKIEKYKSFIEKRNLVNNLYHNDIDTPRALNPKFDSNNFSKDIKPIIIYGTKTLTELKEEKQEKYDRRINYLDSSIWLQYVSNQTEFNTAKDNIAKWGELYNTINAQEIAEFKARQLKNSFVREIEENASHAQNVAPFVFHSQTEMKNKAIVPKEANESELKKLNDKEKKRNLQWRFLLVDDHATKQVVEKDKNYKNENDKPNIIPKCKVINSILSEHFNVKCHRYEYDKDKTKATECYKECCPKPSTDKDITIWFDCADKMEKAIHKLAKTKYDLILLDYLLDDTKEARNYAHDLLHRIEQYCTTGVKGEDGNIDKWIKTNQIGPNGKFQMFYISAFTNAVRERMLEQGLNYHSDYWHISHGACPTTTPYLFLFYLLRRMNAQIKGFSELSQKEQLNITTLLDLLLEIYDNTNKNPREQAIDLFNPLLKQRFNYDNLKYDVCKGKKCTDELPPENASLLVKSLFPDIPHYDNAFWEHTMNLIYLTAFGTIHQRDDMWKEFIFIKPYLQKVQGTKVIKVIYKYITGIFNDSRHEQR